MRDLDERDPVDENIFTVVGPLWLIAPCPQPTALVELCKTIVRGFVKSKGGTLVPYVPVFTDGDLAYRFVERLGQVPGKLKPFMCPTLKELVILLQALVALGETRVGFDSEPTHVRVIPISRVLQGVRNRAR